MKTVGIDIGARTIKGVILEDGNILCQRMVTSADKASTGTERLMTELLKASGLSQEDVAYIIATGSGRKGAPFAHEDKSSFSCLAKGARFLFPSARTVIDLGADCCSATSLDEQGFVEDWVDNDKCAGGAGIFFESMAELLKISLEEMSRLSLQAQQKVAITSTCVVFAEQEVITYAHEHPSVAISDIIAGIYDSFAARVVGMARRIEIVEDIILAGGIAKNIGFAKVLEERLRVLLRIPENPEMMAALGAALIAKEKADSAKRLDNSL